MFRTNLLYNSKEFTTNKRQFIWTTTFKIEQCLYLYHKVAALVVVVVVVLVVLAVISIHFYIAEFFYHESAHTSTQGAILLYNISVHVSNAGIVSK